MGRNHDHQVVIAASISRRYVDDFVDVVAMASSVYKLGGFKCVILDPLYSGKVSLRSSLVARSLIIKGGVKSTVADVSTTGYEARDVDGCQNSNIYILSNSYEQPREATGMALPRLAAHAQRP